MTVVFQTNSVLLDIHVIRVKNDISKVSIKYIVVQKESVLCYNHMMSFRTIVKTCLYNLDPLKPNFYIVKLGFTGYTLFFLFLLKNIDCGYALEAPRRGGSNEYPQSMF